MKKLISGVVLAVFATVLFLATPFESQAKDADRIKTGVYAGDISLAGMTEEEAGAVIQSYVDSLKESLITLQSIDNQAVTVTAADLGISWANPELVTEARLLGTKGNIIQRYKALMDLEYENKVFDIQISFDMEAINAVLVEQCTVFDRPAQDCTLIRENGQFAVKAGQTGYILDVEASIDTVYNYLLNEWNHSNCSIALEIDVDEPRGDEATLSKIGDVLGTYVTSYATSNGSRSANVSNGAKLINGTVLYPGDEFSMVTAVSPFTAANGYHLAGSYLNGKVVDSVGGGICQVSTTLYNAVLLAELDITERYNHSMIVHYVEPSADAAIAESAGKDFRFVNNLEYPIYIEGITTPEKNIIFTIYGVETRAANRQIRYESKVLSTTVPDTEVIVADTNQPIGAVQVQGAYIGYKAELWKVVMIDGVETGRTQINSSSYKMVPRTATVGVVTTDPNAYNEIMAAISTNNIDHVRNVAAALSGQVTPAETEVPVEPEAPADNPEIPQ